MVPWLWGSALDDAATTLTNSESRRDAVVGPVDIARLVETSGYFMPSSGAFRSRDDTDTHLRRPGPRRAARQYPTVVGMPNKATPP
jgi:hypothetical protein